MRAVPIRWLAVGCALAVLVSGCVTYSREKAIERMSEQEKAMLAQISKITKGMTKAEVRDILGKPKRSERWSSWEYYVNEQTVAAQQTIVTPSMKLWDVKAGQFTGKTVHTPSTFTTIDTKETVSDSSVRVFFKNDRVKQINFTHPGLADGWFFYVLK